MKFKHYARRVPQKLRYYLYFIISIPLVLLARVLRPVLHFRFGLIGVEAIGHLTTYHDIYFCEKKIGLNQGTIDIFGYHYGVICNQVLFDMIFSQNKDIIIFRHFGYALYKANDMFKGAENYIAGMKTQDDNATIVNCHPIVKFSEIQKIKAKEALKYFGINKDFIAIHARDSAFSDRLVKSYKDNTYSKERNTNIKEYFESAKWLSKHDLNIIRIGSMSEFEIYESYIYDYSSRDLDVELRELLDIYIQSQSKFVIIGDAGLAGVSRMLRTPMLAVNLLTPILSLNLYSPNSIFITQKYFSKKLNRNLTYVELFSAFKGEKEPKFINKLIEKYDIVFVKNTKKEILLASQEMYYKLTNQWKVRSDEEELQEIFWNIFESSMPLTPNYDNFIYNFLYGRSFKSYKNILYKKINITISYSFLKNNMDLLKS